MGRDPFSPQQSTRYAALSGPLIPILLRLMARALDDRTLADVDRSELARFVHSLAGTSPPSGMQGPLLLVLTRARAPMKLAAIAAALGRPQETVGRTLSTVLGAGWARRDGTGNVSLTALGELVARTVPDATNA
jgi:hypothetical protein